MFNIIHDVETGKITKVDFTADELAEFKAKEADAKKLADKEAKEFADQQIAKAALLEKLGISESEAKLLLS
jgi:hypothetical protein